MIEAVLDASAVLAALRGEPGAELVRAALPKAAICTVNLAEVISTLIDKGASAQDADLIVADVVARRVVADEQLARRNCEFQLQRDPCRFRRYSALYLDRDHWIAPGGADAQRLERRYQR